MAYRGLIQGRVLVWAAIVVLSRLPVAMAPLAFVFSARYTSGGYALGTAMAAAYTIAEALGAPVLGARLSTRAFRRELALGLAVSSLAFAALCLVSAMPIAMRIGCAGLAGASAAAAPGGLRAMVTQMVQETDVPAALSLESVLNMAVWAISPALVALTALGSFPTAPFALAAIAALLAVVLVWCAPSAGTGAMVSPAPAGLLRSLGTTWPIYLTSAAAMYLLATAELTLPALLEQRGYPIAYAGPMLTAFAVVSIVGGILYGLRTWPGHMRTQSLLLLIMITFLVSVVAVVPNLKVIAAGLLLAGLFQAAVLITRNLSLRHCLPENLHPAGYSLLYAASGIGYGFSAVVTGVLIAATTPATAMLLGAGITLMLTLATLLRAPAMSFS